jgi:hypothetical protein
MERQIKINGKWMSVGDKVPMGFFRKKWVIEFIGSDACALLKRGKNKRVITGNCRGIEITGEFGFIHIQGVAKADTSFNPFL